MLKIILPGLFLIFVTLKLTHHIDWSWWWVVSPLYPPLAILALVGGLWSLGKLLVWISTWFETPEERRQREADERLQRTCKEIAERVVRHRY